MLKTKLLAIFAPSRFGCSTGAPGKNDGTAKAPRTRRNFIDKRPCSKLQGIIDFNITAGTGFRQMKRTGKGPPTVSDPFPAGCQRFGRCDTQSNRRRTVKNRGPTAAATHKGSSVAG